MKSFVPFILVPALYSFAVSASAIDGRMKRADSTHISSINCIEVAFGGSDAAMCSNTGFVSPTRDDCIKKVAPAFRKKGTISLKYGSAAADVMNYNQVICEGDCCANVAIPDTAKDGTAVTIDGGLVASWIEGKGVKCFDGGSSNFATCSVEGSSKGATALLITLTGGK